MKDAKTSPAREDTQNKIIFYMVCVGNLTQGFVHIKQELFQWTTLEDPKQ